MTLVNVFLIENANELNCEYRLFRVRGIPEDSEDFDRNLQFLCDRLSRITRSPFSPWIEDGVCYVAQPASSEDPPGQVELVRAVAIVERTDIRRPLRFDQFSDAEAPLVIRFLSFFLQSPLFRNPALWQPATGQPFFQKLAATTEGGSSSAVLVYPGFRMRPVILSNKKLGICVDVTNKYVSADPIQAHLVRDEARRLKGRHAVYEYGKDWYEVKIDGSSDLTAAELKLPDGKSLHEHLVEKGRRERVQRALALPKDCSVLTYRTGKNEVRNVPSALCRLTFPTDHPQVRALHGVSMLPPFKRRQAIERVVREYFHDIPFLDRKLRVNPSMLEFKETLLRPPPLKFGHGVLLEPTDEKSSEPIDARYASSKRELLLSPNAGFHSLSTLGRQYLVLPRSMNETIGSAFLEDLKRTFQTLVGSRSGMDYDPVIVEYDDGVKPSIFEMGESVLRAGESKAREPGHALVVLPRLRSKARGKEDELANFVVSKLRSRNIRATTSHTEVPQDSYRMAGLGDRPRWTLTTDDRRRSRYRGYLENLVLNKILLNNSCWPFVLGAPLHADLVLGIDVKGTTAGFMLVPKEGDAFAFTSSVSQQRERLSRTHVRKRVFEFVGGYLRENACAVRQLVVHRDGTLHRSEQLGLEEALKDLLAAGLVEDECAMTMVEIRKSSRAPIRFFRARKQEGSWQELTENPIVGTYMETTEGAIICTTGAPYRFRGTAKPIQTRIIKGNMPVPDVAEDVFSMANLTWTKPDSCAKVPLSIKWTDIQLREMAGEYDEDLAEFGEEDADETEEGAASE